MSWTQVSEKDILEALEGVDLTPADKLEAGQKNNTEVMTASVSAVMTGTNVPDGKVTITAPVNQVEIVDATKKKVTFKKEKKLSSSSHDPVNHPKHYTEHPSGIECIQITEHMGFNLGNAMKYVWRADLKANAIEDLQKAVWYINREIEKRSK